MWDILGTFAVVLALMAREVVARHRRGASRRALERARSTAIASLHEGDLIKITGIIAPRAPMLMSAVEKQLCIGYSTAVEATKDDSGWRPVLKSAACASFFVTDESGTAVVEGKIIIAPHPDLGWGGDRVSVLGRAKMEIDPAGRSSFRDPPMLNHITGSDDAPVIVAHDMITLS